MSVVRSIPLYYCEIWPVRLADERMLVVFDHDIIHFILHVRRSDCLSSLEPLRHRRFTRIPAQHVQRRLFWFGHAVRHPDGDLLKVSIELAQDRQAWCASSRGVVNSIGDCGSTRFWLLLLSGSVVRTPSGDKGLTKVRCWRKSRFARLSSQYSSIWGSSWARKVSYRI